MNRLGVRANHLTIPLLSIVLSFAPPTVLSAAESPTPFLSLSDQTTGFAFGFSVAAAGDVNGDGFGDVIIGSPGSPTSPNASGHLYIYFGGPGVDSIPDFNLIGTSGGFGVTVAGAGDFDGDGRADVLVGAPFAGRSGRAYLYLGGPAMSNAPDLVLDDVTSPYYVGSFGQALASAGDFNGDGRADLIVGAPGWYTESGDSLSGEIGRAFLYFGSTSPDNVADMALDTPLPRFSGVNYHFGYSVAPAGDVNHDGFSDIIVAQEAVPFSPVHGYGRAYIYYGGPVSDAVPDRSFLMSPFGTWLGTPVSSAGDFNADGRVDFALRAPYVAPDGHGFSNLPGFVYVCFGLPGPQIDSGPDLILSGGTPDDIGFSIASGRDVNGDGYADILAGAPQANGYGRVYVFFGGPTADASPDVVLNGPVYLAGFGESVSTGDLNGDGVADVIVGASGSRSPTLGPGHVYVYDLSVPLRARAYARGDHRIIRLDHGRPRTCVRFSPVGKSYDNLDVDLSTIRLVSEGTGSVSSIAPFPSRRVVAEDEDRDGVAELSVCFDRSDISRLFSLIRGKKRVGVALDGSLYSRRKFRAPLQLTIFGKGKGNHGNEALVFPNPLNPRGALRFTTYVSGDVTARLFDVTGRLVRTIARSEHFEAGENSLEIDGRDDRGAPLATGVYFYRMETADGASEGRFVVAK